MTKYIYYILSALCITLPSCTQDNDISKSELTPIIISSNSIQTEVINPFNIGARSRVSLDKWNNTEIGVLGLSNNVIDDWDISKINTTCILPNIKGIVKSNTDQNVKFDKIYFYPKNSDETYSFYGYHPYTNNVTYDNVQKTLVATISMDGTKDILLGKATAVDMQDASGNWLSGYNDKYVRYTTAAAPNIIFQHKLVRLKFFVTKKAGATSLKVEDLRVKQVPGTIRMNIASKDASKEGKIEFTSLDTDYVLDQLNDQVTTANTKVQLGESVMLPSEAMQNFGAGKGYKLQFTLASSKEPGQIKKDYALQLNNGEVFLPGYSYSVNITINDINDIQFITNVEEWVDNGETEFPLN